MNIEKYIDHTLLKPDATASAIDQLLNEAKAYKFTAVCVSPVWVKYAAQALKGTGVKVATVVGFPSGAVTTPVKAFETADAVESGADEVDMVIPIGFLKDKRYDYVENDIRAVVKAAGKALVKVIIETCLLTDDEKVKACELAKKAGADFVKTSTGFSNGGATVGDIELMRNVVGPDMGVKASGGVRNFMEAEEMIKAGATRIGTSHGVDIVSKK